VKVITDGKKRWIGEGKVNTGKGLVDTEKPPEWAEIFEAGFLDQLGKLKRGPQIITPKDAGQIIALTGAGKGWEVVEGGSGCGFLAAWLGHIGANVHSYEIRPDFFKLAAANIHSLEMPNVKVNEGSVFEMKEKNLDLVVYDLPNPWEGVNAAYNSLRKGGYCVVYLPTAPQVMRWLEASAEFSEHRVTTTTTIDWKTEPDKFRPRSKCLSHTAFICVCRKF
jgi:tRNA (adenine57-N1/adenine58-N1)-methyltransferase